MASDCSHILPKNHSAKIVDDSLIIDVIYIHLLLSFEYIIISSFLPYWWKITRKEIHGVSAKPMIILGSSRKDVIQPK